MDVLQSSDIVIRVGCFLGVLITLMALEARSPRRARVAARSLRWPSNLAVSGLNQIITRLLLPISGMAVAASAQTQGWGLLSLVTLASWVEIVLAVVLLDLAIYFQHWLFHQVPVLWRFHRMHHADIDFDVTTGIRFHPGSILVSALIKLGVIALIGPTVLAVLIFEVLLNATSLFNHSNLKLPTQLDRVLRRLVVTPDMHRVHHSRNPIELQHNFGFNFPWWDRLFKTYLAQPALGHADMEVGLDDFRDVQEARLDRMLSQPWRHTD